MGTTSMRSGTLGTKMEPRSNGLGLTALQLSLAAAESHARHGRLPQWKRPGQAALGMPHGTSTTGNWSDAGNWNKDLLHTFDWLSAPDYECLHVHSSRKYRDSHGHRELYLLPQQRRRPAIIRGTLTGNQIRNPGTIIGNGMVNADVHNFGQYFEDSGTLKLVGNGSSTDGVFALQSSNSQIQIWAPTAFDLHGSNTVVGNGSLNIAFGTVRATNNESTSITGGGNILISDGNLSADAGSQLTLNLISGGHGDNDWRFHRRCGRCNQPKQLHVDRRLGGRKWRADEPEQPVHYQRQRRANNTDRRDTDQCRNDHSDDGWDTVHKQWRNAE